jgi:hypothetical protein
MAQVRSKGIVGLGAFECAPSGRAGGLARNLSLQESVLKAAEKRKEKAAVLGLALLDHLLWLSPAPATISMCQSRSRTRLKNVLSRACAQGWRGAGG